MNKKRTSYILFMVLNQSDVPETIIHLQGLLAAKRLTYHKSIKEDMEFTELKTIFLQIKDLEKRLDLCFLDAKAQKENT
ncbi:MAG TPA: hypothetical protein VM888_08935 [Chitinophagaceae bacterium]|nr:hypothetical protein [Chitinophagaceae bacterium]